MVQQPLILLFTVVGDECTVAVDTEWAGVSYLLKGSNYITLSPLASTRTAIMLCWYIANARRSGCYCWRELTWYVTGATNNYSNDRALDAGARSHRRYTLSTILRDIREQSAGEQRNCVTDMARANRGSTLSCLKQGVSKRTHKNLLSCRVICSFTYTFVVLLHNFLFVMNFSLVCSSLHISYNLRVSHRHHICHSWHTVWSCVVFLRCVPEQMSRA